MDRETIRRFLEGGNQGVDSSATHLQSERERLAKVSLRLASLRAEILRFREQLGVTDPLPTPEQLAAQPPPEGDGEFPMLF